MTDGDRVRFSLNDPAWLGLADAALVSKPKHSFSFEPLARRMAAWRSPLSARWRLYPVDFRRFVGV